MAVKLGSLAADLAREKDGDLVEIPELPGVKLRVRGFGYGPYQMAKSQIESRWVRRYGREAVPPEVAYRDNGRLYADHILLGWEGFDEEYSPEKGLEVLLDPAYRELHEHIRYAGQKLMQSDAEFVEDAAKNSRRRSGGSSETQEPPIGSSI